MDFVSRNFKLQIKEVEGLSHGTPWVEQFRQFVDADAWHELESLWSGTWTRHVDFI